MYLFINRPYWSYFYAYPVLEAGTDCYIWKPANLFLHNKISNFFKGDNVTILLKFFFFSHHTASPGPIRGTLLRYNCWHIFAKLYKVISRCRVHRGVNCQTLGHRSYKVNSSQNRPQVILITKVLENHVLTNFLTWLLLIDSAVYLSGRQLNIQISQPIFDKIRNLS